MGDNTSISIKSKSILIMKKKLNLAMNLIIAFLGVTSLIIKFFIVDGVLAFRAFTVDGNLYTTIVTLFAVYFNLIDLVGEKENNRRTMYFLLLASAVTEAVIFIIVMIGYLPFVPDKPAVTPYHMFCLHVAIPILAVLRFIFFEKPVGVLHPKKILVGAIPIGVYGIGVTIFIKLGILPISLVPYSFLDFKNNFIWYFLFALFVIPAFGYLWSWMFYRLNIKMAVLWFNETDIEHLKRHRVKNQSSFDVVNSSILFMFCGLAILLLSFSLMLTSRTSTKIQHDLLSYISYYTFLEFEDNVAEGDWSIHDGGLYKGNTLVGDGSLENANIELLSNAESTYDISIYLRASDLSEEIANKYRSNDYVSVAHTSGKNTPIFVVGDLLDDDTYKGIMGGDVRSYYEEMTVEKELISDLNKSNNKFFREDERMERIKYYRYSMVFGKSMKDDGDAIITITIPVSEITAQAKDNELNADVVMTVLIFIIFAFLYIITIRWIRGLEKSVDYLRELAYDRVPDEPLYLGKGRRLKGIEMRINKARRLIIKKENEENNNSKE